jgi:RNA polymerase sigma factor (sigma-70 family)
MEAEEVVADVFHLAYRNLSQLGVATDQQVKSWLLRTASYLMANQMRRAMTRRRLVERLAREPLTLVATPAEEFETADDNADAAHQSERVMHVLSSLRDDYRQALVMHALGERGADIGDLLGVSENAARKRLMRARIAFRDAYSSLADREVNPVVNEGPT